MLNRISENITNRLIREKVIAKDDRDVYLYGLELLFMSGLHMLTTVALGLLLGELWQSVLFVVAFMIIRSYGGGYHASTPLRCYLMTTIIVLAALSVIKYVKINIFICLELLFVSSVIILLLSPVEAENKPLDNMEKMIYRKRTMVVWCIEIVIAVGCAVMELKEITVCITLAMVILAVSQVFAKKATC